MMTRLSPVLRVSAILVALAMCAPTLAHGAGTEATANSALAMAMHHYKKENFKKAAGLFLDAYDIAPDPVSLFYAGRSQQRAFLLDEAKATLNRFLSMAAKVKNKSPALEKAMRRAKTHLDEIRQTKAQLNTVHTEAKEAEPKVVEPSAAVTATDASWQRPAGWGLLVLGAASAGYGGWQLTDLKGRSDKLDKELNSKTLNGKAAGLDEKTYNDGRAELESDQTVAIAMTAVGALAAGAGAYLLWTTPATSSVAVMPHASGRGVLVALRF